MRHERNHIPEIAILEIMEEPKIMQIGSYSPSSACGAKVLSPTVMHNHGNIDAVVEPCILGYTRDDKGNVKNYHEKDVAGTIHTSSGSGGNTDQFVAEPIKIRQATEQGYIECPVGGGFDAAYPSSKLRRGRVQQNGDVVGAITASADGHCVYEGAEVIEPLIQPLIPWNRPGKPTPTCPTITSGGAWESNNMLIEPCGCYDNQSGEFTRDPLPGISRTIKTDCHNAVLLRYRIRKLTEREVFRLMDVDDADIDKIEAYRIKQALKNGTVKEKPIPKSAKYKLAGNSIVVDVLYHIFYQMFIAEPPKPKPTQLSLFD